jgi:hypothetical protein
MPAATESGGTSPRRKALATNPTRWPRKVTLDDHTSSHRTLRLFRRENPKRKYVEVRTCKYLNNIVGSRSPPEQVPL